ncbi:polysaccharide export protein [Rheinheimera baltica]|uniref:Polysaccharide export protein n=1 Tax=Rheinheimera baltica TaxID=67576 RepID=A0ABT9HUZ8_9GAMM|nr:polysaccharide biosynthesis/export family protein [Rheinheimera baltica]MDP5134952.1 polysaccharide export protein [Rheinheimera baltica]MDP5149797.1 polysaccharide export protein [Rheinheimera baltica]
MKKIVAFFYFFSCCVCAQSANLNDLASQAAQAKQSQTFSEPQQRTQWQVPGTIAPLFSDVSDQQLASKKPFGSELFEGGFRGARADGMNPDYRVMPGDQVTLRLWGAIDFSSVLPVDSQGNLFVPSLGPVKVVGLTARQLDGEIKRRVMQLYPDNVSVYTNLQGVQPVSVFVSGFVSKPGNYAGVPADSVLYFLDQAGGVDAQLGSFRRIRIIRDNKKIEDIDLYQFLLSGKSPSIQFENGDTIIVDRRGPVVYVSGEVGREHLFELDYDSLNGNDLMMLAQLNPGVSHALVRGFRSQQPYADYHELTSFGQLLLGDGDEVTFVADERFKTIVVQLEGSFNGRSHFVVPKDTHLLQLLDNVPVNARTSDIRSISIRRLSVAEKQKQSLAESLRRLEATYLGASSSTLEESAIRIREAELITKFVEKASQVEPTGRLVISFRDELHDLRLQDGDIITIPRVSDDVLVSGEVFASQSQVFVPGIKAIDYIKASGGFSQHADRDRILVVRQNGEIRDAEEVVIRPGDEILVLPKVETKNLQLATTISQILYQIAIAAKVALDL